MKGSRALVNPGALTEQRIEQIVNESKPAAHQALPPQRQKGRPVTARARRQGTAARQGLLFQGIFPAEESNLGLLHCRQILY